MSASLLDRLHSFQLSGAQVLERAVQYAADVAGDSVDACSRSVIAFFDPRTYQRRLETIAEAAASAYVVRSSVRSFAQEFPNVSLFVNDPKALIDQQAGAIGGTYLALDTWTEQPATAFHDSAVNFCAVLPASVMLGQGLATMAANSMTLGEFAASTRSLATPIAQAVWRAADVVGENLFPPTALTPTGGLMPIPAIVNVTAVRPVATSVVGSGVGEIAGILTVAMTLDDGSSTVIAPAPISPYLGMELDELIRVGEERIDVMRRGDAFDEADTRALLDEVGRRNREASLVPQSKRGRLSSLETELIAELRGQSGD